jgi:outer membrane immunogenic protein
MVTGANKTASAVLYDGNYSPESPQLWQEPQTTHFGSVIYRTLDDIFFVRRNCMGRKFWGFGLLASIVASGGVAGAADLAVQAPVYPVYKAPPVILSDWAGFYVGVHAGYGWGDSAIDPPAFLPGATLGSLDAKPKGGVVGGHAGYNWQYGSVVTGLEIDYSAADINASGVVGSFPISSTCQDGEIAVPCTKYGTLSRSIKFDELATARARLGYTVLPNLLAYGTAGLAWGHSELTGTATAGSNSASATADASSFGWAGGGGLEYKAWEHIIVRAEYLHYDFGKTTYSFPFVGGVNAATTIDVVRGGVSYKF